MLGKNWNFYVKKMQKFVTVLVGVLWLVTFLPGCTKKEEETMLLLSLEEEAESESEDAAAETGTGNGDLAEGELEDATQSLQGVQSVLKQDAVPEFLYVHVCGAVQNPGVYELPDGSRVYEAVESAGGFNGDADEDYVNQAQMVPDGAKIVIPTLAETEALVSGEQSEAQYGILTEKSGESRGNGETAGAGAVENGTDSDLLNLNTATRSELCELPGIGETKADAIIDYRTRIGVFTSKEQIMEIEGIKDGLYSKIKDKICVE